MTRYFSRSGPDRAVQWEFDKVVFPSEFSRNVVTKLLLSLIHI